jgi:pimeloyl-ACP methyl ester carboxylesterase
MMKSLLLALAAVLLVQEAACTTFHVNPVTLKKVEKHMASLPNLPYHLFQNDIDHFNRNDNRTFEQRYTVNATWVPEGGLEDAPVFIFLAGEATMEFFGFQEVQAKNAAEHFGALYITLEHRYYGLSLPFEEFTTENLRYLTSEQALADAANFINSYRHENNLHGPWVVFGCSYSGGLSAWFRLKYPQLVIASVAPSGPVLAHDNYTGYLGHFQTVAPTDCVDATVSAVASINQMLKTSDGRAQLEKDFNTCEPITPQNEYFFKWSISLELGGSDQMDNPPHWPLNKSCDTMTATSDYVFNWGQLFPQDECNDFSEQSYINYTRILRPTMNRAWNWQCCTEFGYFMGSYNGTSIFFDDLDMHHLLAWCEEMFDIPHMRPDIHWTNTNYGGKDLVSSETMFTNGHIDPWHLLSITSHPPPPSKVEHTNYDAGHCATLIEATDEDPQSLTHSRTEVFNFLSRALAPYQK